MSGHVFVVGIHGRVRFELNLRNRRGRGVLSS